MNNICMFFVPRDCPWRAGGGGISQPRVTYDLAQACPTIMPCISLVLVCHGHNNKSIVMYISPRSRAASNRIIVRILCHIHL